MTVDRRDALLKEYGEVSSNFRALTDIRFRLLTLLPIATAATAIFKTDALSPSALPLALFGLTATIGLITYNARNDQLYDELIGRAAMIERLLGLPDGAFANRPVAWLRLPIVGCWSWKVSHRPAISLLYGATIAFWVFMALDAIAAPLWGDTLISRLAAMVVAVLATVHAKEWVAKNERQRARELRQKVGQAVDTLLAAEKEQAANWAALSDTNTKHLIEAAALLQVVERDHAFLSVCANICGESEDKIGARARSYSKLGVDELRDFVPSSSGVERAAFLLALLVDLPPRWISDVRTNRRGAVPAEDWRPPE